MTEAEALGVLRSVLDNPHASWSCDAQRDSLLAVMACENDVCAILRTGAGKTMLIIIPAMLEGGITVVILPLKSLVTDYERRLVKLSVPHEIYDGPSSVISGNDGLILVSVDKARTSDWHEKITMAHEKYGVTRIVFDEAHFSLTGDDFRDSLRNLSEIRNIAVQVVLLSGTVPPFAEKTLTARFGLRDGYKVFRTDTDRPELEYIVASKLKTSEDICRKAVSILNSESQSFLEEDRALIYVPYTKEGEQLAKILGCDLYHGGQNLSDVHRQAVYQRWIDGQHKVMVCTGAFSAGNDYSHVRLIIHAGTPYELISCVQEMSRAGRDGQKAKCFILAKEKFQFPVIPSHDPDYRGKKAMWDLLYSSQLCIRFLVTQYNDGKGVLCRDSALKLKCSRCRVSMEQPGLELHVKGKAAIPNQHTNPSHMAPRNHGIVNKHYPRSLQHFTNPNEK